MFQLISKSNTKIRLYGFIICASSKRKVSKQDFDELMKVSFGRNAITKKVDEIFEVLDDDRSGTIVSMDAFVLANQAYFLLRNLKSSSNCPTSL